MNPNNKPENPPAFPCPVGHVECYHPQGMSLRDYFAAQVIGPLVASDGFEKRVLDNDAFKATDIPKLASEMAYEIADAMLAERSKQ